ncbi:uncharacterized protein LOC111615906 [Centruroides sculpturatus]|uniref:uncharacterized protein LOC111615906 n=1 Tax=Centruroides sculpturatus TaxID=218467 RepID=UPI000C6E24CD|nr:uncharacterized protein LOC111615906 [Centruroides sculpturatus]XP_023213114.1 uncharacterized protein LOC111615906 [Centruroides sculpturatus]
MSEGLGAHCSKDDGNEYIGPCAVCGEKEAVICQGVKICMACKVLFDYAVRSFDDPMCHNKGSCGDEDPEYIFLCNFCRLDKCYKVGMKFIDHYEDIKYFYRDIQIRLASEHRVIKRDEDDKWEILTKEFSNLKHSFLRWISRHPEFQKLDDDEFQSLVKRRYDDRGLVMEIVDQSFDVHLVLKIGECFWDPWKYESKEITTLMCDILELTLRLRDHCESREQFYNLKLKLIMRDDIEMELNEDDRREVEALIPLLDKIEIDLRMLVRKLCPEKL